MSHFKLFVVGDDIETLLRPFDEAATSEFVDCTDRIAGEWLEYQAKNPKNDYGDMDTFAEEYFGYEKHNGVYGHFHNPLGRLDWWEVGGRYKNYLINKNGSVGDSFKVKDIDFAAIERRNEENAKAWWAEAHLKKNAAMVGFMYGIEPGMTIDEYVKQRTPISAWAVLIDTNWIERGKMGWFGMSSNETDHSVWEAEMAKFIKNLDPEQTLTVVDCHV